MINQEEQLPARVCLHLSIRTSAAAFSARYHDVRERLYLETLESLGNLESHEHTLPWDVKVFEIEHIQAWLLLVVYEYMHMDKMQASPAMSRALRLTQRCRLGDLDASGVLTQDSFAIMEEKSRTFWLTFCFDRLLNTRNDLNWALPKDIVSSCHGDFCSLQTTYLKLD